MIKAVVLCSIEGKFTSQFLMLVPLYVKIKLFNVLNSFIIIYTLNYKLCFMA
jgi:hypothetical protein